MIASVVEQKRSGFRADINGLRAIAVVAVVLFHFKVAALSGGFVGVDVFFVVSGYLMTKIILGKLQNDSFSVLNFYAARARRIVPALLGLSVALLVFGVIWIDPETLRQLGQTIVTSLLFVSNFQFWREAGYFDARSETKWLLHTWSLAVEWQFYIVYPIFLMAIFRVRLLRPRLVVCLWAVCLISFALSVVLTPGFASASFFLLPTRAWELLAGAIVAAQFKKGSARFGWGLHLLGLAMVLLSIGLFDNSSAWPSYRAALPVVGTALVIAARRSNSPLTGSRPAQFLGSWSYAIYIWHWPIVVGATYLEAPPGLTFKLVVLALLIAAAASAVAVFKRRGGHVFDGPTWPDPLVAKRLAFGGALTLLTAGIVVWTGGLEVRQGYGRTLVSGNKAALADWTYPRNCRGLDRSGNLNHCRIGPIGESTTLVVGDSFAEQLYPRAEAIAKIDPGQTFDFVASDGCPPVPGVSRSQAGSTCSVFTRKALDLAQSGHYKQVLIVSMWYTYFSPGMDDPLCFVDGTSCIVYLDPLRFEAHVDAAFTALKQVLMDIEQHRTAVTMLLPTPFSLYNVPAEILKRDFFHRDLRPLLEIKRDQFEEKYAAIQRRIVEVAAQSGVHLVDPLDTLCPNGSCPTAGDDAVSYYKDSSHFRASVATTGRFDFLDRALEGDHLTSDSKHVD